MSKKLVAYFSASGITADKARQLADAAAADLFAIEPVTPYTRADLDWTNKHSRSTLEMTDAAARPDLKHMAALAGYDTIYIGFPIWWGVAPRIINTFIEKGNFTDKKIMLFATSGGSGIDHAVEEMKKTYPQLNIVGGRLLNSRVTGDILE